VISICTAKGSDAPAIAAILSGWIDETDWMPRVHPPGSELGFAKMLLDVADVTVARDDAGVLGFLARQDSEIQADARGRGLGGALLDHAKEQTGRLGLWTFQANSGSLRFYMRHGFVETERSDGAANDEHLPDIRLIWEAAAP